MSQNITGRAALLSLIAGTGILALKFVSFFITNSQAILADALESIVNVVAAAFALVVVRYAARPPDREHPYGHGKTEFFSAAFEGGLITFAAILILFEGIQALIFGHSLNDLGSGSLILFIAGCLNALLGFFLLRVGKSHGSMALVASGAHILSDVWTTAVALVGLATVYLSGNPIFDPLLGLAGGIYLAWNGIRIVRRSIGGLLDEEDRATLLRLTDALSKVEFPGIIRVHRARIMQSGSYHYIDAHVVVPEFWDVKRAHDETNTFERAVIGAYEYEGEIHFHLDPCRRAFCSQCDLSNCPVRQHEFVSRKPYDVDEIIRETSTL